MRLMTRPVDASEGLLRVVSHYNFYSNLSVANPVNPSVTSMRQSVRCLRRCDKWDGVSADPVSLQAVTETCEAFRAASAHRIRGAFRGMPRPQTGQTPRIQHRHFGAVIAIRWPGDFWGVA
jgi:hypothetical protein